MNNLFQSTAAAAAVGYAGSNGHAPTASSSPTVDMGVALTAGFTTDIRGVSRPQGSAWDIGAYEFTTDVVLFDGRALADSGSSADAAAPWDGGSLDDGVAQLQNRPRHLLLRPR